MLARRLVGQTEHLGLHQVVDDQRSDRDLGADVEKDARRPHREARPAQQREGVEHAARALLLLLQPIALRPDDRGDHGQRRRQREVGVDHHLRLRRAIGVERRTGQRRRIHRRQPAEDHDRSDIREDRRAERVERLREGQPARRRLRLAQQRDQRIGDDLNDRDPRGEDEQREQEHAEGRRRRRRDEQQAPRHHRDEADRRGLHVARPPHDRRRRQRDERVGREERRLDQQRLRVAEREQLLQLGDDDVVERGDPAEDEEQREHEDAQVGRVVAVRRVARRRTGGRGRRCVDVDGHEGSPLVMPSV